MLKICPDGKIFGLWAFSPQGCFALESQPVGLGYGMMHRWCMAFYIIRRALTTCGMLHRWCRAMGVGTLSAVHRWWMVLGVIGCGWMGIFSAPKGQHPIAQPNGLGKSQRNPSPEGGQSMIMQSAVKQFAMERLDILFGLWTFSTRFALPRPQPNGLGKSERLPSPEGGQFASECFDTFHNLNAPAIIFLTS